MSDFRDHLSTIDEAGKRLKVYPALLRGNYTRARVAVRFVLINFFLLIPWLKVGGKPFLLLNVSERKFFFLGQSFMSQDLPAAFFMAGAFFFSVILLTVLFGRAWCGWACPQTVFVEGVFRRIERWIEGDHIAQKKLDQGPFIEALPKKAMKWLLFAVVSLVITHSFLGVFVGGDAVWAMMRQSPLDHFGSFLFVFLSAAFILLDFGWLREQFCLIACPYGRFQSVLTDRQTVSVGFDYTRKSDCIDCRKCVFVCPTGIDIRNGPQMECIGCTACIDACDFIMDKVGTPRGLIRYGTEVELGVSDQDAGRARFSTRAESRARRGQAIAGHTGASSKSPAVARSWKMYFRPRVLAYGAIVMIFLSSFGWVRSHQEPVRTQIVRSRQMPYQSIEEAGVKMVLNHFNANLYSTLDEPVVVSVEASGEERARGVVVVAVPQAATTETWTHRHQQFFVKFPRELLKDGSGQTQLETVWRSLDGRESHRQKVEVKLVGPES